MRLKPVSLPLPGPDVVSRVLTVDDSEGVRISTVRMSGQTTRADAKLLPGCVVKLFDVTSDGKDSLVAGADVKDYPEGILGLCEAAKQEPMVPKSPVPSPGSSVSTSIPKPTSGTGPQKDSPVSSESSKSLEVKATDLPSGLISKIN